MFKISIIVPVFNVKNYIDDAFESILNQTIGFENLEVIFVDRDSDDGSSLLIDEYSNKYENVIYVHLDENSKSTDEPRNIAMEYATSDYLMFLDPNDIYMENACELLYYEIITENVDMVSGIHTTNGEDIHQISWKHILTEAYEDNYVRLEKVNELVKDSDFSLKIKSIDDCPKLITNYGMWTKIYKKSFLEKNNIKFPKGIPAQDTVFLFDVLLNANGIKFINQVIADHHVRNTATSFEFSKECIKEKLDAYFEMFYISSVKNKVEIFKYYILFNELNYFLKQHLMNCKLPTNDLLDILEYAHPLFKLCVNENSPITGELANLFKYIANKDYENALEFIQGEKTIIQNEIKIISHIDSRDYDMFNDSCCLIELSIDDWLNQFENENPNLFLYSCLDEELNFDALSEILKYCKKNNIITLFLNNQYFDGDFSNIDSLEFDFFFDWFNNEKNNVLNTFDKKIYYLNDNYYKFSQNDLELIGDDDVVKSIKSQTLFNQILDAIDYVYIPNLIHLVLCYNLRDLKELNEIYDHFYSINYPYKHIKLITDNNNLSLSDSISKLESLKYDKNYHIIEAYY